MRETERSYGVDVVLVIVLATWGSCLSGSRRDRPGGARVDYVAELNRLVEKGEDEGLNAAPLYKLAIDSYVDAAIPLKAKDFTRWPTELTAEKQRTLREWVKANAQALDYLREGTERPEYWFQYEGERAHEVGLLDRAVQKRELFWVLMFRAKVRAVDGDVASAVEDMLIGYRFASDMKQRLRLYEQLVGIVMLSFPLNGTFQMLARHDVDAASMALLQEGITEISRRHDFVVDLRGERLATLDAIQTIYPRRLAPEPVVHTKETKETARAISALKGEEVTVKEVYEGLFSHTPEQLKDLARKGYDYYDSVIGKTPFEWRRAGIDFDRVVEEFTEGNILLDILTPAVQQQATLSHHCEITKEALLTTLALQRYESDKGWFPRRLAQLVSAGCLDSVPMDPYSDGPLVYRRTDGDFVLYSLGADFDDDGGVDSKWGQDQGGGDQVFWPVQGKSSAMN
ncbi:MAG: hypothetical protein ACYTAS_06835 [Planctomycetota bacterium]|jgi:hypothetical protein